MAQELGKYSARIGSPSKKQSQGTSMGSSSGAREDYPGLGCGFGMDQADKIWETNIKWFLWALMSCDIVVDITWAQYS